MGLANGTAIIDASGYIFQTPMPMWDGLTMLQIIEFSIFLAIVGWFVARMLKGKSHSEAAILNEPNIDNEGGGGSYAIAEQLGDIDAYWAERGVDRTGDEQ